MYGSDTTKQAHRVQARVFAAMTGSERVKAALEMFALAREISKSRLRHQHPELDEPQLHREWIRLLHGDAVANRISC